MSRAQNRAGDVDGMCLECVHLLETSAIGRDEVDAYCRQERERMNADKKLEGQEERKESPARWGHPLYSADFIRALRKLIPGLYANGGAVQGDISLYRTCGDHIDYVCYLTSGIMPEFEIIITDKDDLPVSQKRGWRTVLLRLINKGLITEEQADKTFGRAFGEPAKFYLAELQKIRQRKYSNG